MRTGLGDQVVATLPAPADPRADMGARIEVPYTRAIVSYWRPAVLVDAVDAIGNPTRVYQVILDGPVDAGDYLIVFRTGDAEPPDEEYWLPLAVERAGSYVWPGVVV